jgi:HSF-type DNA-binding
MDTRDKALMPSRREDHQNHTSRPFGSQAGCHGAASDMTSSARSRLVQPSHRPSDATTGTGYNGDSGWMRVQKGMSAEMEQAPSWGARNPLLEGMPPPASSVAAHLQSWTDPFSHLYPRTLEAQVGPSASRFLPPLLMNSQPPWFGPNAAANMPSMGNYQSAPTFGDRSALTSLLPEHPQADLSNLHLHNLRLAAGFSIPNTMRQDQPPLFTNPPNTTLYGDAFLAYPGTLQQLSQSLNPPETVARYPFEGEGIGLGGPISHQTEVASSARPDKVKKDGVFEPFPARLHRLLTEAEAAGQSSIISFSEDGRAFFIHKPAKFFRDICNLYFRQSRLSSFKRQLHLYGFELMTRGPNQGGYYHEYFHRDHPELVILVRRTNSKALSKETKRGSNSKSAPDFYKMPPIMAKRQRRTQR